MKIKWEEYFYFTKTERNGIFILACLCTLGFLTPQLIPLMIHKEQTDFTEFRQEIEKLEKSISFRNKKESIPPISALFAFNPNLASREEFIHLGLSPTVAQTIINYRNSGARFFKKEDFKKIYGIKEADYFRLESYMNIPKQEPRSGINKISKFNNNTIKKRELTPFFFNPNTATKEELLELGLAKNVAQTILNYRAKGGSFREKKELKRIYGLVEEDYLTLKPFINIPKVQAKQSIASNIKTPKNIPQSYSKPISIKIDINRATVEDWQKLKGIGPNYSNRIVNFRHKLGGFISIEQITTTYGVPDSVIQNIKTQLILSPIASKIPINTISPELLTIHPFFKTKQAYTIINYRVNHGNFQSIEDIKKIRALTPEFINKIEPYLSFN